MNLIWEGPQKVWVRLRTEHIEPPHTRFSFVPGFRLTTKADNAGQPTRMSCSARNTAGWRREVKSEVKSL